MIVGLTGYTRTGKTELSRSLDGWISVGFADKLREFLYELDPIFYSGGGYYVHLADVIDDYGWDGYKDTRYADSIRNIIQRVGTECGRGILGENVWVNALFDSLNPNANYIIHDVRFVNEARAVRNVGGWMVEIRRDGTGPVNSHSSEQPLDRAYVDNVLYNDSTMEDLSKRLQLLVDWIWEL